MKGDWAVIIAVLIVSAFALVSVFALYKTYTISSNECLKNVAEEFCEDRGWRYGDHRWDVTVVEFNCVEEVRQVEPKRTYRFTEAELERCLG